MLQTASSQEQTLVPSFLQGKECEAFFSKEVLKMERSSSVPDGLSSLGTRVRTLRVKWTFLTKMGLRLAGSKVCLDVFSSPGNPSRLPPSTPKNLQNPFLKIPGKVPTFPSRFIALFAPKRVSRFALHDAMAKYT